MQQQLQLEVVRCSLLMRWPPAHGAVQERQAEKRWGKDPEFVRYRASTPLLLPLPRL